MGDAGDDLSHSSGPDRNEYIFPVNDPSDSSKDAAEIKVSWTRLCVQSKPQAKKTCRTLESHGIPTEFLFVEVLRESPFDPNNVEVLVPDECVETARAILDGTIEVDEAEEREFDKESNEQKINNWQCPNCNARKLEILPWTEGWKIYRLFTVGFAILPPLVAFLIWAMAIPLTIEIPDWLSVCWLLATSILLGSLLAVPRRKRCTVCSWQSDQS